MAPMVAHLAYRIVALASLADWRQQTFLCPVVFDLVLSVRIATSSPIWGDHYKVIGSSALRLDEHVRIDIDSLALGAADNRLSDVYDFFCRVGMIESLNLAALLMAP